MKAYYKIAEDTHYTIEISYNKHVFTWDNSEDKFQDEGWDLEGSQIESKEEALRLINNDIDNTLLKSEFPHAAELTVDVYENVPVLDENGEFEEMASKLIDSKTFTLPD